MQKLNFNNVINLLRMLHKRSYKIFSEGYVEDNDPNIALMDSLNHKLRIRLEELGG